MDLNRATLIGRLTRDPELRNTNSGKSVTSFGLATNRYWKDQSGQRQESTEFHNIVMWGRLAEIASQYLNKGKRVYVEGRLQTRDWTGQDGAKRRTTEIVADNMIMLDSPRSGSSSSGSSGSGGGTQYVPVGDSGNQNNQNNQNNQKSESPKENIEDEIKVEDIPF